MCDWKKVNMKYISEGELYLSFDFLDSWHREVANQNKNKEGARYKYPESLIRFCSVIKICSHLGYRQEQGFLKSLQTWIPIPEIISYTQINRRINNLGLDIIKSLAKQEDAQIIAIDSSGIKLYNSGEWIREKHKKRKPFLKLHIAVNTKTKQAVAIEVTEDSVGDNKLGLKLIDKARKIGRVSKGILDGAYDAYDIWNGLNARGIKPLIRLRKNAVIKYKKSQTRSQAVKCYKGNEKVWVKANDFGQRWQVECYFSSFKRRFGEFCFARKPEFVLHEVLMKCCLLNSLIG